MSEDAEPQDSRTPNVNRWVQRMVRRFGGGPRTREDLMALLSEARSLQLMDADALTIDLTGSSDEVPSPLRWARSKRVSSWASTSERTMPGMRSTASGGVS